MNNNLHGGFTPEHTLESQCWMGLGASSWKEWWLEIWQL